MNLELGFLKLNKKEYLVFFAFLLLAFLLRSVTFFKSDLSWDEGLYLLMARSMIDGNPPYVAIWDHKPPGIFVLFAVSQLLLGKSILSIRILASLAVAISSYVLYRTGKLISKRGIIGLLAGVLYAVFSLNNEGLASNSEIFFIVFVTLAFYLLFTVYPMRPFNRGDTKLLVTIGLIFGIGIQISYLVLFDLSALLLIIGIENYSRNRGSHQYEWIPFIRSVGLIMLGSIIVFSIVWLYFLINGHFQDYLHSNLFTNFIYSSSYKYSLAELLPVLRQQVATNVFLWICLLLIPVFLLIDSDTGSNERKYVKALVIWFFMTLLAISFSKRFYPHYFLHLLPPACLLSAYLVIRVAYTGLALDNKKRLLFLVMVLMVPLLQNIYPILEMGTGIVYFRYIQDREYWGNEVEEIAEYLRKRITPNDYIYAVDLSPTIYYLVPARTPTKYVFPPHLLDKQNRGFVGIDPIEELSRIVEKQPIYIIKQYHNNDPLYIELDRYLGEKYVFETSVNGVELYRLKQYLRQNE